MLNELVHDLFDMAAELDVELPLDIEQTVMVSDMESVIASTARILKQLTNYRQAVYTGYIDAQFNVPQPSLPAEFKSYPDLMAGAYAQMLADRWYLYRDLSDPDLFIRCSPKHLKDAVRTYFSGIVHKASGDGCDTYSAVVAIPLCASQLLPMVKWGLDADALTDQILYLLSELTRTTLAAVEKLRAGQKPFDVSELFFVTLTRVTPVCSYARVVVNDCTTPGTFLCFDDIYLAISILRDTDSSAEAARLLLQHTASALAHFAKLLTQWQHQANEFMRGMELASAVLRFVTDVAKQRLEEYAASCATLQHWESFISYNYPGYYTLFFGREVAV